MWRQSDQFAPNSPAICCPRCECRLKLHQPDPANAARLVASCDECKSRFLTNREGVALIRVPESLTIKATSGAPTMLDYRRVAKGDVLEITGVGAPGYGAVGDRVRVVHVGLDNIVVEDKAGRWAKFVGNQGARRLRAVEEDAVKSSDRPRVDPSRHIRIPERVSQLGVDAELL
jgi:hypothetical protein